MALPCKHYDAEELQNDKEFKKLSSWNRSVSPRLVIIDEVRHCKVLSLRGDMDPVTVGIDRETWIGGVIEMDKSVMPSQDGMGVRSCSRKLWTAEHYARQWHRKGTPGGTRRSEADPVELAKALELLG